MNMTALPQSTQARLAGLRFRHRGLDRDLRAEQGRPVPNFATVKALKRDKLRLKDEIARLEGLMPTLGRRRVGAQPAQADGPEHSA